MEKQRQATFEEEKLAGLQSPPTNFLMIIGINTYQDRFHFFLPNPQIYVYLCNMKEVVIEHIIQNVPALYQGRLLAMILYGSVARGNDTEDSDIDLLLVFENEGFKGLSEIKAAADIQTEILLKWAEILSILPTTRQLYTYQNSPLYLNIKKEGKIIWKKYTY